MTMLHCLRLSLLVLYCVDRTSSRQMRNNFLIQRKSVEIVDGDKSCITDCSRMSARNNAIMNCSVDVCEERLKTSARISQRPQSHENIFLQKYSDDGEDKLALYVSWSPAENEWMKYTGYLIHISDGISEFSACYQYSTRLELRKDAAHDKYHNECFGKAYGTKIVPGSVITFRITNFPLWYHDIHGATTTGTVEIPDCENSMMHSLPDCQVPGGRPTKKACISDKCDTMSEIDTKQHPITCNLSKHRGFFTGLEQCDTMNKTGTGMNSKPIHVTRTQEWYKYIDPVSGDVRLALNFSWMPANDSNISSLHNFRFEIMPIHVLSLAVYDRCYSIHTELTQGKHRNATFFYDCYGRADTTRFHPVHPGGRYIIHIESQPSQSTAESSLQFTIDIPDCKNEAMAEVTKCAGESRGDVSLHIIEKDCLNMSVKVNYSFANGSEKDGSIFVCEAGDGLDLCTRLLATYDDLPSSGILDTDVASSMDYQANFTIFLTQRNDRLRSVAKFFNFSGRPFTLTSNNLTSVRVERSHDDMTDFFKQQKLFRLACLNYRRNCQVFFFGYKLDTAECSSVTPSNFGVSITTSSDQPRVVINMAMSYALCVLGIFFIFSM